MTLAEQSHCFGESFHLPAGAAGQQALELAVDDGQLALRRSQQSSVAVEGLSFLCWPGQLPHQGRGGIVPQFRRQKVPLGPEAAGEGADVLHAQGHAKHLAGRVRQLVGLVYDKGAGIREDGPAPAAPVDGVCQQ